MGARHAKQGAGRADAGGTETSEYGQKGRGERLGVRSEVQAGGPGRGPLIMPMMIRAPGTYAL
jgi:hypothetical protein